MPLTTTCRRLFIPDDPEWLAIVSGAIFELTKDYNFEAFGSITPQQCAERFRQMWERQYEGIACMIGAIVAYANETLPDGLLACDGTVYDRVDYPDLYNALDSSYHISADTFSVPDLRDKFVVGAGAAYNLADTGGENTHTLTTAEIPSHNHIYTPPTFNVDLETPGAPDIFAAGIGLPTTTSSTGGDGAHENRPPYYALVWAIVAK